MNDAPPDVSALDAPEPPALAAIPAPAEAPKRKSRSGTSGAERRRRAAAAAGTPPKTRAPAVPKAPPLEKQIAEALDALGALVAAFVDPFDGAVLSHNAPRAGKVLADMAARRPGLERMLRRMLAVGDNLDGLALLGGMLLPILIHHGMIPAKFSIVATLLGTAPPAPDADAANLNDLMRSMFTPPATGAPDAAAA